MASSTFTMRIDDATLEYYKTKAAEKEVPVSRYISDLLTDKLTGAENAIHPATLDDATKVFMDLLDPAHRDLILQCADERHMAPAAFLLSAIKLAHERGEAGMILGEISIEPALQQHAEAASAPKPAASGLCEWCHNVFVPTRPGQRYCPPPADGSEPCGRQAGLADIRMKLRTPSRDKQANVFAPKTFVSPST